MADTVTTLSVDAVKSGNNTVSSPSTELLSAYLPLVFEVSSSVGGEESPIVQAEIQYGSSFDTLTTLKKEEITVSGSDLFRFDVSYALQTVLSPDEPNEQTYGTITTGGETLAMQFRVKFALVYTNALGNIVEQEQLTSSTYWVTMATVPPDNSDQDLTDWTIGSSAKKFLTNIPNNTPIYLGEEVQLAFLADNSTVNYAMYYEEYNLAGIAQGTSTTASTTIDNRYGIVPINALAVLSNHSTMSKVDVWIQNTDGAVQASEKKTFIIKQASCSEARIRWVNPFGGIDQHTFEGFKRVTKSSKRVTQEKPLTLSYTRNSRGLTTIGSERMERWMLASGIKGEDVMDWLDEMLTSIDVTINQAVGYYEPIIIVNDSTVTIDSFGLQQFVLEFDKARKRITHIG